MQSIQPEQFLTAQIQSVQEQSVQGDVQVQLVANASVQVHVQIMIQAHAQIRIKSKPTPKITFKFKPRFTFKSDSEPSVGASSNMTERTFKMQVVLDAHGCYAHANGRLHVHVATNAHPDLILIMICLLHVRMHPPSFCFPWHSPGPCLRLQHVRVQLQTRVKIQNQVYAKVDLNASRMMSKCKDTFSASSKPTATFGTQVHLWGIHIDHASTLRALHRRPHEA